MKSQGFVRLAAVLSMWPTMAAAQESPRSGLDTYMQSIARDCHSTASNSFERPPEIRVMAVLRFRFGPSAHDAATGRRTAFNSFDFRVDRTMDTRCEPRRMPLVTYAITPAAGLWLGQAPGH